MTQQKPIRWRVGDTAPVVNFTCQHRNALNVMVPRDLTGKTVKFKMTNMATGAIVIAETDTGVTKDAGVAGTGNYDFATGGAAIATPGIYRMLIRVLESSEPYTFPVHLDDWLLYIDSDTQSAEAAYAAAVQSL